MTMGSISSRTTPLQIFVESDVVVQSVIVLLLAASAYSWGIIIARFLAIAIERRKIALVRSALTMVEKLDDLRELATAGDGRVHSILRSLAGEWKWSSEHASRDYDDVRMRLVSVAEMSLERQYLRLAGNSAWLATIGNAAPFFGLLGTVWGIMNSFIAISQAQDTSLATVAPGMAEALFATAVGLFCAIPASIGYNRIIQTLGRTDQEWRSVIGRVEIAISRHYGIIR
jgi:biopolymer transport protein ExbB/TolQ